MRNRRKAQLGAHRPARAPPERKEPIMITTLCAVALLAVAGAGAAFVAYRKRR